MPDKRSDDRIEASVADFLIGQGYRLLEQNFICKAGKLDLVVQSASEVVFVEVCWRRDPSKLSCTPYIRPNKQQQWLSAAEQFLKWRPWTSKLPHRFDMVVVSGVPGQKVEMTWFKNLFSCQLTSAQK